MMKPFLLIVCVVVAGCIRTKPMDVGVEHPANPDAPVATAYPPSPTLHVVATSRPVEPQSKAPMGAHEGHGAVSGHRHGDGGVMSTKARPATTRASALATYSCPMHPEVTSDRPGKCPKCGMNLTQQGGDR
jgi:hypothetical protein